MTLTWRDYVIAGLSVGLAFMLLWNRSLRQSSAELTEKLTQVETEYTKLKTQLTERTTQITETTRLPDGTVTTRTTKVKDTSKVSEESADKVKVSDGETKIKVVKNDKTRYSIHTLYDVSGGATGSRDRLHVGVGARIGDLPIFGIIQTDSKLSTSVGVQLEW